jgi:hypothetical protein
MALVKSKSLRQVSPSKALGVTLESNAEGEAACRRRRNPKLGELPAR